MRKPSKKEDGSGFRTGTSGFRLDWGWYIKGGFCNILLDALKNEN